MTTYEENRRKLNNSRFRDPDRWSKQLETGKRFITETAKELTKPENIQEMLIDMAIDSSIFLKSDNPYSAFRTILARRGTKFILNKADIPTKVAKNYNDLNRLTQVGEEITRKTGIENVARDSGVVQFLGSTNVDDIFTKNSVSANKVLSYQKLAQQYQKVSKLDMPVVKGYKACNIKEYNKYVQSELEHWAKHGKGSGNYFILEHPTDATKNIKYRFDNKGARTLDGILSDRSFSWKDLAKKSKDNKQTAGTYRAKTKGAQITLEEYIEELGEELGKKGFELDKQRMRRLRRWIGKNVHLDHIQPISKGGFDHPANMILLYAKDNLSKNAKVLPDSFFTNMKIPKTKQELIRSSLRSPEIPNKVKREVILELLIK